jgi:hypothetical protein
MHLLSQSWQMFAQHNARDRRFDRLKFAPNLTWRIGFHVPHVEVAGTAVEKQNDAVVGLSCSDTLLYASRRIPRTQCRKSERSKLQDISPIQSVQWRTSFEMHRKILSDTEIDRNTMLDT